MSSGWILWGLIAVPALLGLLALAIRSARVVLRYGATVLVGFAALGVAAVVATDRLGELTAADGWLRLDALSAYHLFVMVLVFALSGVYAVGYFEEEVRRGEFSGKAASRFVALLLGAAAAMVLVLVSNNLGLMWVGIEATTLLTAFLICIHGTPASLEAMWKYLVMCSVGVALAFAGILLLASASGASGIPASERLLWTALMSHAGALDPRLVKLAFIFMVVGFGTKAGLAPMHSWLPDAHSQAPAPVSAVFSGFLLNAALYCILRCKPLVDAATGNTGWAGGILVALGVLSILVAAAFIVAQSDIKRLLAYSSVEHIGIIALGAGLGGFGAVAALFHMLNHSLCKTVSFFSAGSVGQAMGTQDIRKLRGVLRGLPPWGAGLFGGLLALIGLAPFALFLSELMLLKAAWEKGSHVVAALFLAGLCIVFIGVLRHAIAMAWSDEKAASPVATPTLLPRALVYGPLACLLVLGLWIPSPLFSLLTRAAAILGGPL